MDEEKGVSIGEIFSMIFSQKWLALIIAVVITLVGTLVLKFGYDPAKSEYVSTFSVNLVTTEKDEATGKFVTKVEYPNGQAFSFRDLVSKSNLQTIKDSDEAFSGVDIDKMYKRGDVGIKQNTDETSGEITYTVSIKAKYFDNSEIAADFIDGIVDTPSRVILNWVKGQSAEATQSFEGKSGFEAKMQYINTQLSAIQKRFNKLNGLSGAATERVKDLISLATALTGKLHTEYFEPSAEVLRSYVYAIGGLQDRLEVSEKKLEDLKATSWIVDIENVEEYSELSEEVTNLKQQIEYYEAYLENYKVPSSDPVEYNIPASIEKTTEMTEFEQSLSRLLDGVKALTDTYETDYYNNTSLVSYDGTQVTTEGGLGLILSFALSLIVGLILAAIIAYVVAANAKKKALAAENADFAGVAADSADAAVAPEEDKAPQKRGGNSRVKKDEE